MTLLPGLGSYDTTVADFNDDGFTDIELTNSYTDHAYLYWGGKEGFSEERRMDLPAGGAWGSSVADLDRDGHLDLIFPDEYFGEVQIYWGGPSGYSDSRCRTRFLSSGSIELADRRRLSRFRHRRRVRAKDEVVQH